MLNGLSGPSGLSGIMGGGGGGGYTPTGDATVKAWYRADLITSLWTDIARTSQVAADGDRVASETDLSGNGNHTVQATGAVQPVYKTNIQNGLPGLYFAVARNDYLDLTMAQSQPYTIYCAMRYTASETGSSCLHDRTAAGTNIIFSGLNASGTDASKPGIHAGTTLQGSAALTFPNSFLWTEQFNGASSFIRINGVEVIAGDAGALAIDRIRWGSSRNSNSGMDGYLFERLICAGAHDATKVGQVESYINSRWALH